MRFSVDAFDEKQRPRRRFEPLVAPPACVRDPHASSDPVALEGYARLIEESGHFRVLRRLPFRAPTPMFRAPGARLALFVDLETTGPDPGIDEIIEFAIVPFRFATASGRILAVHEPVRQLREPSRPIPARISRTTGIDADAVRGRAVDEAPLAPLIAEASLVVAHNAAWDRPFLERLVPGFADLPWGCSLTQVPWRAEHVRNHGLAAIAAACGFFYPEHRAVDDCLAAVEILGRPLPRSGTLAMAELVRNAERESRRVWALGAPYEARDLLRRRGYRWSSGDDGRMRSWVIDVDEAALEGELSFLRRDVFGGETDVPVMPVDRG